VSDGEIDFCASKDGERRKGREGGREGGKKRRLEELTQASLGQIQLPALVRLLCVEGGGGVTLPQ